MKTVIQDSESEGLLPDGPYLIHRSRVSFTVRCLLTQTFASYFEVLKEEAKPLTFIFEENYTQRSWNTEKSGKRE
jgi:hypothetical protein